MPSKIITFTLNGRETEVLVKPLTTLQTLLREQLRLTAVKSGCRQGGCGSCTVLLNGQPVLSCVLPVEDVAGQNVTTLEGVGADGQLHPVQQAFFDEYAVQCGYCTPGMIMTSTALLNQNPHPERAQILDALTGNYCRCTGYEPIVRAIQEAARRMDGQD
jgi:aerobic carbon-monoxide dehydrogenase small subunit